MTTLPLQLTGQLARGWTQIYTIGLPTRIRAERQAEIASDLWEQATDGGDEGKSARAVAAHIFGRTVLGMPADVAWHLGELKGDDMQMSIGQKSTVGAFIALGLAALVFSVMITVSSITQGWFLSDVGDTILGLLIFIFMAGPFIAIAGVYSLRRANAEGRSTKRGRTLIVVGTLFMGGTAGVMWWTVIGPVIAIAVVSYWVYKIKGWRGENRRAA